MSNASVLSEKEQALITALEKLNVVELNTVVKYMEKTYGISATAVAAVAPTTSASTAPAEEKTAFTIELSDAGSQKIAVIKVVRELTGLPLGEAKAAVDGAPKILKENVAKEDADKWKKKLEEAGAKVSLQ